jgi:1-deoxy-D-xylulose-5-phosphate synthase
VDIYSTFLQRSYDQVFQEVALQNLPVVFMLDRSGLTGPDGPTHHGVFDIGYMRMFPNIVVMAPGDEDDLRSMLDFALSHDTPCSIRYPKAAAEQIGGTRAPIELGRAEVIEWGEDGLILCCGTMLATCVRVAETLGREGLDIGVVNARFVKPLDSEIVFRALEQCPFVVTVEEAVLAGGFGSAVLEAATDAQLDVGRVRRLGIPDRFVEHGDRGALLADLGLDAEGIANTCRRLASRFRTEQQAEARRIS